MQRYLAIDLVVETKPDLTPVSDADRAVEQAIREYLGNIEVMMQLLARSLAHQLITPIAPGLLIQLMAQKIMLEECQFGQP
jgi:hypothetical protein